MGQQTLQKVLEDLRQESRWKIFTQICFAPSVLFGSQITTDYLYYYAVKSHFALVIYLADEQAKIQILVSNTETKTKS